MKVISNFLSFFLIGFYLSSLFFEEDLQKLKIKSIVFLVGIIIATILRFIDDHKKY